MNTQVGQTISANQFKEKYPVGAKISAKDFANKYGSNTPEDKITGIPKNLLDLSQGAGGLLRTLGLGGITDLMNTSPAVQLTKKATGINPLINSQDKVNQQNPLMTAGKDIAGAAGWALPMAKGASILTGLTSGGLLGASQTDATLGSVAGSAVLGGAAIPALSSILKLLKIVPKTPSMITSPLKTTGQKLASTIKSNPAPVSNDLLEKYFGTFNNPNPELYKGAGAAQDTGSLLRLVRNEMATMGKGGGGILKNPTPEDIFGFRQGAYNRGQFGKGDVATPMNKVFQNMGRAYSGVLHEAVPQSEPLDQLFSNLSSKKGLLKLVGKRLEYVIPAYVAYKLLGKLGL